MLMCAAERTSASCWEGLEVSSVRVLRTVFKSPEPSTESSSDGKSKCESASTVTNSKRRPGAANAAVKIRWKPASRKMPRKSKTTR